MSKAGKNILRVLLPLIVLAVAALAAKKMIEMRPQPQKAAAGEQITTVQVASSATFTDPIHVKAGGTVLPAQKVELRPQVSGQIVEMAEELQPGGFFAEGEVILRIDARDYEFALQQRRAELERARFELTNEKGLGSIAAREWELLGDQVKTTDEGKDLTLRKPHLRRAEASLEAAKSMVEQAKVNLDRTVIRAPFNAQVQMENVDMGQLVNPNTLVASLTGTDRYWIQVSVPVDEIGYLTLPDRDGLGGASAVVKHRSGDTEITREGKIVRLLGDLEQAGRMARLLVQVDNPLGDGESLPLLLNAYVQVEIEGKPLENAIAVPAQALREGNKVWVMTADGRLEIRQVDVVWEEREQVLLRSGVASGESIVTSRISTPIPGMKLKVEESATPTEIAGGAR
ncbi:MAG: efflux RND transporter periplasmic adaptor subunit [Acidobacteriota bacterium]|nr:efflux RND transporter periplasmic adaptor subunit [Acidobacteriota bacterium]